MKKYIIPEIKMVQITYPHALCSSPGADVKGDAGDIQGNGTDMAPGRKIFY